jgi:hypothetical protein
MKIDDDCLIDQPDHGEALAQPFASSFFVTQTELRRAQYEVPAPGRERLWPGGLPLLTQLL